MVYIRSFDEISICLYLSFLFDKTLMQEESSVCELTLDVPCYRAHRMPTYSSGPTD